MLDENTVILYEDECSLSNTATLSRSWSIRGNQPRIKLKQRGRERLTLFGCVNIKSGEVSSKTADRGNYKSFKKFLKKVLRNYVGKKIIMILDNVRYHHAKSLKPFLQKHAHRIELMFLPPYSPDLNCMERIWWYMRKKITHNMFVNTIEERKIKYWKLFSTFEKENEICKTLVNLCVND